MSDPRHHKFHRNLPQEEQWPCGVAGLEEVFLFASRIQQRGIDLSDCRVVRPKPFRLVIWEPLRTKAPKPPKAQAYCCYFNTVIFYHFPYVPSVGQSYWRRSKDGALHTSKKGFEEWDQVRFRLTHEDIVRFEGELFAVGGGRVDWVAGHWWHCTSARRVEPEQARRIY